jgi:hypothetical protein
MPHRNRKNKNPSRQQNAKGPGGSGNPGHHEEEGTLPKIPNPLPVQVQPTSEENTRHADQDQDRKRGIQLAGNLNKITAVYASITLIGIVVSLLGVLYNVHSSREALKLDQRAWVGPITTQVAVHSTADEKGLYFEVPYSNIGKTPALQVHSWIGNTGDPKRIEDHRPDGTQASGLLLPGGIMNTSTSGHPISLDVAQQIEQGASFYVYGQIWYEDIFKQQHWTRFCFQPGGQDLKAFAPCTGYNDTDD